jgi:4,5-dihydroxyphthalate decarboxylase
MSNVSLTLVVKDYDHLAPLASGDVQVKDIDLSLERDTPGALGRTLSDPSIEVGELSFSRHIIRVANNDRSFVGIPIFPTHGFRHRCFFVRRDSGFHELQQLAGKRIGTNEWPATGNTWSRATLREQGVSIDNVDWWVGPVDDPDYPMRPQGDLPANVQLTQPGQTLVEMLLGDELDALMCPIPPRGFYAAGSSVVRLFPDYPHVEKEYYRRTGIYPAHHIIGIRRQVFDRDPWIARNLYKALDESKTVWQANRRRLTDTTPWLLADIEESTELIGHDWHPNGVGPNRKMIQALCDEEYGQGLISEPLDGSAVFAEFEAVMSGEGN